ncbi:MAG: aspartate--tRNA ligase [Candidatus Shikimatogenerans bostrichidophilus]|nr:MAG: aspartate--tRNA ligase [Candidatus Shikimatogenerans bostrichidophilus]
MYRTHNCGELNIKHCNYIVTLSGWVDSIRLMKNITFIDIRDFYGITQLLIPSIKKKIKKEYLIQIKGKVVKRKSPNYNINTGNIEVYVNKLKILNKSIKIPIDIKKEYSRNKVNLLKYRYLYLRNFNLKNNLIIKSKILNLIRNFFIKNNFIEIETPLLVKSTSEGARNFIVPYRKKKGYYYSLPQSPQTFKQLLMIGGIDKYYQIVKCFRDEDIRKDRQPEFTQLDFELSFINRKNIFNIIIKFIKYLLYKIHNIKFINIKILSYKYIIKKYYTDKPDLRFKIYEISKKYFKYYINSNYLNYKIYSLILPNYFNIIDINKYVIINLLKDQNNKVLIYNYKNSITNRLDKKVFKNINFIKNIIKKEFFSKKDLLLFLILNDNKNYKKLINKINNFLLRSKYLNNIYIPIIIYKFPLFKYRKGKFYSYHHPFTNPYNGKLINNINKIFADSYDLIINGIEIGSGSIRIDNYNMQKKIFNILGLSKNIIKKEFNYFLESLKFGTPPHGGMGIGIDRLILSLFNKKDIMDFIAFPKNYLNKDLMIKAPSKIIKI